MKLKHKHILGLRDMESDEIRLILETAQQFKEVLERPIRKVPALRGKSVCTVFYEPSTRTRSSFELAAKIMSAETFSVSAKMSSATKGESLKDTIQTLDAMGVNCMVMRHGSSGAAELAARYTRGHIINAGDGRHAHPTQGLLDLLTISEHKSTFEGLKVVIVGDIWHSRVARSTFWGLKHLGADVTFCGPETLLPQEFATFGAHIESNFDEAIKDADVVMMLRLQNERMHGAFLPSVREYSALWGLNARRLKLAKPDAIVMHPGPINRGVEIASDIADGEKSVILEQVNNGVAVRMALLHLLLGGEA